MRITSVAILVSVCAAAACAHDGITALDGARIGPGVLLRGIHYIEGDKLDIDSRPPGERYGEVLRQVDCSAGVWLSPTTHVEDMCLLEEGDSDFLPAGTPIYRIQGVDPGEALAVYRIYEVSPPIEPEWRELRALDSGTAKCLPSSGNLCTPSGGF